MIKTFFSYVIRDEKKLTLIILNYNRKTRKKLGFLSYSNLFLYCHTYLRQDEITKNLVIAWLYKEFTNI